MTDDTLRRRDELDRYPNFSKHGIDTIGSKRLLLTLPGSGEVVENVDGLADLCIESLLVAEKVDKFRVIHLEQHAGDLAREVRLRTALEETVNKSTP